MLNGPTLSHTYLLPKPSLARRSTTLRRFSTPSSSISSKEWLRLAPASEGLPTLEDRPPLLQNLVHRRHLGEAAYRATGASARTYRAKHRAERGHIVDSQSVKTTGVRGERGYDSGKKVKGRKRHLFVDTQRVWCSK